MTNSGMIPTLDTTDLAYTNPGGKYQYQFDYLGKGIFSLKSKGYIDEKSFKIQLSAGDIARERLARIEPGRKYILIWDVTEVSGISLRTRHMILSKLSSSSGIRNVKIAGANFISLSFAKMIGRILPQMNLSFYKTSDEALRDIPNDEYPENRSFQEIAHEDVPEYRTYKNFITSWESDKEYIVIGNHRLKCISDESWHYESTDKGYEVTIKLVESYIVYYECEGFARPEDIDATYTILEKIIHRFSFNETDHKFYSVLNLKKLRGISLSARKNTSYHEQKYKGYSLRVIIIPSNTLKIVYNIVKKVSFESFFHWEMIPVVEQAFSLILSRGEKEPEPGIPLLKTIPRETTLEIPGTRQEMLQMIRQLREENNKLKAQQETQIKKILDITGRMTWDESFHLPDLLVENDENPFKDIFYSLAILFQDFQEILGEKTLHARKLEESEDKYRNLINLANDIIIVLQDETIQYVNSRMSQNMGYLPEELIGQKIDNYIAEKELQRVKENSRLRQEGEDAPWIYETELKHKNGLNVPFSISIGNIIFDNRPAYMIIARDISLKKKNEQELEQYKNHLEEILKQRTEQLKKEISDRKVAEESDRLKSAFLSNMSHEIRTPMNAIISFSKFLKNEKLTSPQRIEYLNYIISSGQSLLNLINDIIDISKIEAGHLKVSNDSCNVNHLLEELFVFFEETRKNQQKNDINLLLHLAENKLSVVTDPYRLKQIISNLLDNALKFTQKGVVEFGYFIKENFLVFYVKDTGVGIPADKTDYIFQRFGKIESNDKNISGTGLGLAISKNLAQLLKGELWVESTPGLGSVFYLQIPYQKAIKPEIISQVPNQKVKPEYHWEGLKVLIAEDEELNFKVLQITLLKTGIKILRAMNGIESITQVENNPDINLILMDIQMPEMNGYEAMMHLKKSHPNIPIIAQTAFALADEQQKCLESGFDDYIVKPINFEELMCKMNVYL